MYTHSLRDHGGGDRARTRRGKEYHRGSMTSDDRLGCVDIPDPTSELEIVDHVYRIHKNITSVRVGGITPLMTWASSVDQQPSFLGDYIYYQQRGE